MAAVDPEAAAPWRSCCDGRLVAASTSEEIVQAPRREGDPALAERTSPETNEVMVEMEENELTDPNASDAKGAAALDRPASSKSSVTARRTLSSTASSLSEALDRRTVLELTVYLIVTCCYYVYRSQGSPTFTHAPFKLQLNDLWGVLFVVMFALTRRGSYLVYAINPLRNLVLVGLQSVIPGLREHEVAPEFYRDIVSTCIQLTSALCVAYLLKPKPMGSELIRARVPFLPQYILGWVQIVVNLALVGSAIAMIIMGTNHHTDRFSNFLTDHHGWKIILAILLGSSEEVTWREAYLNDNNNTYQAITWGMNHLVVGEGMSNPFVYGLISFAYAFVLGVTEYRFVRYLNHACIEYLIMDNLIKTEILV